MLKYKIVSVYDEEHLSLILPANSTLIVVTTRIDARERMEGSVDKS